MFQYKVLLVLDISIVLLFLSSTFCEESFPKANLIGIVGKKLYQVNRFKQNWAQAKQNCEEGGFKFATIRSDEELEFLSSQFKSGFFHGWHWIAARDSRKITQFVWDSDNTDISINPTMITDGTFNSTTTFLTCGAFQINENGSGVSMVDCSKDNGYALCEFMLP